LITAETPLVLGSASPRRREILSGLGVPITVLPADVVEDVEPGEVPLVYLSRIVDKKLAATAARPDVAGAAGVLVADTTVVVDDAILGKPSDVRDAEALLSRLVGRTHVVYTRYAIARGPALATAVRARTVASKVTMRSASDVEIRRYAQTGEGLDKAGAYAVQGIGAFLIERIEGSYSNVVGLPACEVIVDLVGAGLLQKFP
jgi:septum formation protein